MVSQMLSPITAPAIQEPPISLIKSANDALHNGDETNGRWLNGIAYQPISAPNGWVHDPCDGTNTKPASSPDTVVEWSPFLIGVDDVCSAIGFRGHQFKDRLDQKLKVARHKQLEKEFWGGALAQATSGSPNAWLTKSPGVTDLTPGTVPSVKRAVEILEQGIADHSVGIRGMIHARPEAAPHLTQVRRVGNLILTIRDTIIVLGTGYPNTGPNGVDAGANTWLFATGLVDVRLSTDVNYMTVDPLGRARPSGFTDEDIVANMNRSTNLITTRAEVAALASWDHEVWLACKATLDA